MAEQHHNAQLQLALDFVEHTSKNIFLTGKAGTGKTTFLQSLKKRLMKRMIVVAPTGVAAMNAGGVTIHSFFQLPFGPYIPTNVHTPAQKGYDQQIKKFSREKINIIRSLDLLVIDEISMVRADMLDAIDEVLRRYKDRSQPFGGVQLLMIGDLQQLAPVAKEEEWKLLKDYYNTVFFFGSRALQQTEYVSIMLQHIYRQQDNTFIDILNGIRENKLNQALLQHLNTRYKANFSADSREGYITLTTHNWQAQQINELELGKIQAKEYLFKATIDGDFPEYIFPTEQNLILKKGAQVMFVKNDASREKRYYNGKIGTVIDIKEEVILVQGATDKESIYVEKADWHNYKYAIDEQTKEIRETIAGVFSQYPLKLAWAITIHKSQGLTFDKAIIDANAAFTHGQVYVALSRCRSLEGLVLRKPISLNSIISDASITGFTGNVEKNQPTQNALASARQQYQERLLLELFDFRQLKNRLGYCYKLMRDNAGSLAGTFHEDLSKMEKTFVAEVMEVSHKFVQQMKSLGLHEGLAEDNQALQTRVKQASVYFAGKVNTIVLQLKTVTIETDNKEVRKTVTAALENLQQEVFIKHASLQACINGFTTQVYLEAKAKASLENAEIKPQKKNQVIEFDKSAHPELYNRLRKYRDHKAADWNVPAFMVLPIKTLEELTHYQPRTMTELKKIKGLGKKKIEQMGEDILEIINSLSAGEKTPAIVRTIMNEPEEKTIKDTKQESFDLFEAGETIDSIARTRKLTVSTVEGHLAHYVGLGKIDITRLVSEKKMKLVESYYQEYGITRLSEAKAVLGDAVSFGDLRLAMKYLEYKEKTQSM